MRVAIIGGTGFVGGYLVDALTAAGHDVAVLVRPGSEAKLRGGSKVTGVPGELGSASVLHDLVDGCDAVIYNVGLLREFPRQGITFEQAQFLGVVDTVSAMREAGVRRLLLMSAIGVKHPGTRCCGPQSSSAIPAEPWSSLRNSIATWCVRRCRRCRFRA